MSRLSLAAALPLICLAVRYLPADKVDDVVVLGPCYLISESLSLARQLATC